MSVKSNKIFRINLFVSNPDTEAHLEPNQTSKMELLVRIVNGF